MMILDNAFISKYSGYNPSPKLFPAVRSLCHMQSIYAWRMIYLLHRLILGGKLQSLTFHFSLSPLLSTLGISSPEAIPTLLNMLQSISEQTIFEAQRDNKGTAESWTFEPWFYESILDEKQQILSVSLNPSALPFFYALTALAPVRLSTCQRLSRGYPTWLYIVLTNASKQAPYWCISLSSFTRISHLTGLSGRDSRIIEDVYKKNFQTLGLKRSDVLKTEEVEARKEKRSIYFKPMILLDGGNMLTVRSRSELLVNVCQIKGFDGYAKNSVSHVAFSFLPEDEYIPYLSGSYILENSPTFAEELNHIDVSSLVLPKYKRQ